MTPKGPFDLARSRQFFGGWASPPTDAEAIVMAFPVEGWRTSAAVVVRQERRGRIVGDVHGAGREAPRAWQQALATLSLDVDGRSFSALSRRDAVIGGLQRRYGLTRPTLFLSPYEAATHFVLSHRRSIAQSRATRARLAEEHGDPFEIDGATFHAFPQPQVLRKLRVARGLDAERLTRLCGIADAALDGTLDRKRLRGLSIERALVEIRSLRGIGEFFAQGILFRGAGIVDDITKDEQLRLAVQRAYGMGELPDISSVEHLAEKWRPYRMWAEVLLVLQLFGEGGRHAVVSRPRDRRRTVDG
ncbi:MAG TPA: DNA-3-methyladenine glycosylase 2 family protein [Candidatus Limnocylindria bacterium]|nr:DNA-3-methyladenine glycosylase 2 family protein [Candidatus Limnocylindria bacterium]